jgi:4-diphosphocytidyl-2-C-methyl-D-erythritol kinase
MILFPKSKINVGLQIIEKRPDGYHNLESLFLGLSQLSDILEIVESDKLSLSLYGMVPDCRIEQNLCVRAYRLLECDFNLPPVEIHLHKNIPTGAGLGGGSSDGAAALIILNRLFCLGMDNLTLADYASRIGSDCPYFIYANQAPEECLTPMLVSGRGELLEPIEVPALEGISVKIETPNVFISTAEAYRGVVPEKPQIPLRELLKLPLDEWRDKIKNDFEKTLFAKYPQLDECKENFYRKGAVYASMSGSGSSVFGLFAK